MDIYNELDYKVLEISETDSILKEPHIALNQNFKKIITKASRVRKMSSAEYANFLGFKGYLTERDTNRDSKIINFFGRTYNRWTCIFKVHHQKISGFAITPHVAECH